MAESALFGMFYVNTALYLKANMLYLNSGKLQVDETRFFFISEDLHLCVNVIKFLVTFLTDGLQTKTLLCILQ